MKTERFAKQEIKILSKRSAIYNIPNNPRFEISKFL